MLLVVSRAALMPRYLVSFDEINFALSIRDFNPGLHQPQPPGYPLFVGLLKALSWVIADIETLFLVSALLLSAAALALLWQLSESALGGGSGLIAALLLLFNPVFWLSSLTNPVRLCLAVGAIAAALFLWRALELSSAKWFLIAAAAIGVAAGFRLTLPLLMAPLFVWVAFTMRLRWTTVGMALVCSIAGVLTWLPVLVYTSGGLQQYIDLLRSYSEDQLGSTSVLYGAAVTEWLVMGGKALVWSCLGAISWLWAVPLVLLRKRALSIDRTVAIFLGMWFIPGLLIYATLHAADPDHTLAIVPVTCILGAIVLSRLGDLSRTRAIGWAVAAAVLLNVFLFFKPISKTTKPATYRPVEWLESYVVNVVDGAKTLSRDGPLVVVVHHDLPGWRHLSYYVPEAETITITTSGNGRTTARRRTGGQIRSTVSEQPLITVTGCANIAWADPYTTPSRGTGERLPNVRAGLFATRCIAGQSFDFHGVRFVIGP